MTFTYDLSTDIGVMRLYLLDKVGGGEETWSDEELQYFLTDQGTVKAAVLLALDVKLNEFASPDYRDGQLEESDFAEAFDRLSRLRDTLANQFGLTGFRASVVQPYRASEDDS